MELDQASVPAEAESINQLGRAGARLKSRLGENTFRSWFGQVRVELHGGTYVRLSAPSAFVRDWLADRYVDVVRDAFRSENPEVQRIEIVVRPPARQAKGDTFAAKSAAARND